MVLELVRSVEIEIMKAWNDERHSSEGGEGTGRAMRGAAGLRLKTDLRRHAAISPLPDVTPGQCWEIKASHGPSEARSSSATQI